ncbi:MAG: hypothetical protein EHM70_03195 [Chloroflexota bacterium]|nr:MAG: hypothetical protein EHM70_03195 [Chloroflexota bacterium]
MIMSSLPKGTKSGVNRMAVELACPRCGHPVDHQARTCHSCGIDLALAVVLAESALRVSTPIPSGVIMAPEILVPRLGDFLLERGVLQAEDLQRALEYQQMNAASGKPGLLGQTLLELGLVDRETLDQVITEQILHLQAALQQSNRQLEQRVQERTVELQNALNRLAELNQLKSNFISNISHEFRTPLTHIKGYLDLLADESLGPLTCEQGEAMEVLLRSETRLEQLIEDLIRFSLAARGEFTLKMAAVNLPELITLSVNRAQKAAQAKHITLKVELTEPLNQVWIDEEKITWVFLQLLDNAVKFTPDGGQVSIDAVSDGMIIIVGVTDTGIGIPPDRIEEVFEPFHQLDSSNTRRYGGTGLGLALVRRII